MQYNAYDFFDTVVHRDCHPEQILYLWSKSMAGILNFSVSSTEIYNTRKYIENKYKNEKSLEELNYTYFLEKIYNELCKYSRIKIEKSEFISIAQKIELEIEKKHIYLDKETVEIIKKNYSLGNKIILISDFYADKSLIVGIMKSLDIYKYFDYVFISSEYGVRKSTGNLYKKVFEVLNIKPEELTMLGDNIESDYNIPKRLGVKAKYREYSDTSKIITQKELSKIYDELLFNDIENKPFNIFLSEIIYFISNLHKTLIKENVRKVAFCSREGQLLKLLFDKYQEKFFKDSENLIETKYLYVSRQSTLGPSLNSIDDEDFDVIFRQYKKISLKSFLETLKITEENILEIATQLSVNNGIEINKDSKILLDLKKNTLFIKLYNELRKEREIFEEYIFDYLDNNTLHLVDIGWKGTIQDNIQKALPKNTIKGYYFGLIYYKYNVKNKENKYGILMYDYPKKSKNFNIVSRNTDFYEDIFVANHGSTIGYKESQGSVEPIISQDDEQIKIYNHLRHYQEELVNSFDDLLSKYNIIVGLPYEYQELLMKKVLKKVCIYLPRLSNLIKESLDLRKENFVIVESKKAIIDDKIKIRKKILLEKKDLFWVDYSYKFFRFNLLAKLYCNIVYILKYLELFVFRRKNEK